MTLGRSLRKAGALPRLFLLALGLLPILVAAVQSLPTKMKLTTVAGVSVGMRLERAREVLGPQGKCGQGEEQEREERGTVKEAWTLSATEFKTLAYKAGEDEKIQWITGWIRAGHEIPFEKIGDKSAAARFQPTMAIWNVQAPSGAFRVVARGVDGRASIISIISLSKVDD